MDPSKFMLVPHSMTDAEYNSWGSDIPYLGQLLEGLDYKEFNITHLMPSFTTQEKPAAGELIDPPHLLWTVYAYGLNGFAWECVVPHNPNIMGNPFPPKTWAMSLSSPLFFLLSLFFLVTSLSFFELQPTIQEHEELVWLARNLKLEVTNYSRILYGPRGAAYPSGGDDDDDGGGDEEDSEVTLNYQPTKRRHHCLPAVNTYRHTTHIFLFCCFYLFIFSFS
ncbi:uncharacterized protein LOC115959448 [Quercus lobata]|uniref:uncharacterized protein LOC115959448 n=1 Tax=Quercus lobata TaxID=97700 RepID=UPI0012462B1B|nr:uncharacterized protein LOC115959448 [Quercus lobata]XP_030933808.1 uncharacterized protein LOC115959448 [Quercus lobata]